MLLLKEKSYDATPFIKKVAKQKLESLAEETVIRYSNSELKHAAEKGYFRTIKRAAIAYIKEQQIKLKKTKHEHNFQEILEILEKNH